MENKINELNCWIAVLILMLFWFIIYSCVQINKLNKRIDTTQQLVMELDDACPVVTDQQMRAQIDATNRKVDNILIWIDELKNSVPSYMYRWFMDYDGIACDNNNNCKRYIYIDDDYFHELPTNS